MPFCLIHGMDGSLLFLFSLSNIYRDAIRFLSLSTTIVYSPFLSPSLMRITIVIIIKWRRKEARGERGRETESLRSSHEFDISSGEHVRSLLQDLVDRRLWRWKKQPSCEFHLQLRRWSLPYHWYYAFCTLLFLFIRWRLTQSSFSNTLIK